MLQAILVLLNKSRFVSIFDNIFKHLKEANNGKHAAKLGQAASDYFAGISYATSGLFAVVSLTVLNSSSGFWEQIGPSTFLSMSPTIFRLLGRTDRVRTWSAWVYNYWNPTGQDIELPQLEQREVGDHKGENIRAKNERLIAALKQKLSEAEIEIKRLGGNVPLDSIEESEENKNADRKKTREERQKLDLKFSQEGGQLREEETQPRATREPGHSENKKSVSPIARDSPLVGQASANNAGRPTEADSELKNKAVAKSNPAMRS